MYLIVYGDRNIECYCDRLWKNLLNEVFYLQDIISNKDKTTR